MKKTQDLLWMRAALCLAQTSLTTHVLADIPTAALVVYHGTKDTHHPGYLLAAAINQKEKNNDPSAHAELTALKKASKLQDSWRLLHCTLYTTLEPCIMCTGAILQARLPRVVYGARSPKFGALGSLYDLSQDPKLNHHLEVTPGVLEDECGSLLTQFFKARRAKLQQLP